MKHQHSQNCKICVKNIRVPLTADHVERFFRECCGSEMTEFQRGKRKAGQTVHSVQIVFRTPETAKRFLERPYLIVNSQIVSVLPPTFNKTVQIGIPSTHSGVSRSDLKNEVMGKIGNEHPLQSDIEFDKDNTTMFLSFETRKGAEAARKELCTQGVFGGVGNVRWLEEESRRFGSEVVAKFRLPREWFLSGEELSRSAPTREDLENRLLLFEEVHGRLEKVFMDMFYGWVSRKEARPENKPTFEVHVGEKNWLSGAVHVGFKRTPKGEEDARRCVSFFSENSRSRVVKITYRRISKELHLSVQIHVPKETPSAGPKSAKTWRPSGDSVGSASKSPLMWQPTPLLSPPPTPSKSPLPSPTDLSPERTQPINTSSGRPTNTQTFFWIDHAELRFLEKSFHHKHFHSSAGIGRDSGELFLACASNSTQLSPLCPVPISSSRNNLPNIIYTQFCHF
ncbi:hypothetical protein BLNAU_1534 [Blattamonas nauphoetae]|uniref:RRM domain-containing protein n=1 Tax=Blattamonas nauphoetae TaxID=2049346 RepID=A0ABQ9YIA6_9EUKA|nr:hypothetical protein BLNAU_1534 [Blattamonas nauphoetae]